MTRTEIQEAVGFSSKLTVAATVIEDSVSKVIHKQVSERSLVLAFGLTGGWAVERARRCTEAECWAETRKRT